MQSTNLPDNAVGGLNRPPTDHEGEAAEGSMSDLGNESLRNLLELGQIRGDMDQSNGSGGPTTMPGAIAPRKAGAPATGAEGSTGHGRLCVALLRLGPSAAQRSASWCSLWRSYSR